MRRLLPFAFAILLGFGLRGAWEPTPHAWAGPPVRPGSPAVPGLVSFVYQPGGVAAEGVYPTWAALYAAASVAPNPVIIFDGTYSTGVVTIPTGTWAVDGQTWTQRLAPGTSPGYVTVSLPEGAHLTLAGTWILDTGITVQSTSTVTPTMTLGAGQFPVIMVRGSAFLQSTGAPGFVSGPSGVFLYMGVGEGGALNSAGGPVITLASGGSAVIIVDYYASLDANMLAGAGSFDVAFVTGAGNAVVATQTATNITWFSTTAQTATFAAGTTLTATGAQNIPPSGTTTSATDGLGVLVTTASVAARIYVSFTGSALNVAGQTASITCSGSGSVGALGTVSGIATTAGAHAAHTNITPVYYPVGTVFTCSVSNSAGLTGALTDLMVTIGG